MDEEKVEVEEVQTLLEVVVVVVLVIVTSLDEQVQVDKEIMEEQELQMQQDDEEVQVQLVEIHSAQLLPETEEMVQRIVFLVVLLHMQEVEEVDDGEVLVMVDYEEVDEVVMDERVVDDEQHQQQVQPIDDEGEDDMVQIFEQVHLVVVE